MKLFSFSYFFLVIFLFFSYISSTDPNNFRNFDDKNVNIFLNQVENTFKNEIIQKILLNSEQNSNYYNNTLSLLPNKTSSILLVSSNSSLSSSLSSSIDLVSNIVNVKDLKTKKYSYHDPYSLFAFDNLDAEEEDDEFKIKNFFNNYSNYLNSYSHKLSQSSPPTFSSSRKLFETTPRFVPTCNKTAYDEWSNQLYEGNLLNDAKFWIYQTQSQIHLTNGLALELSYYGCKRLFKSLILYKSGRMGPVTIQDAYKIMCRPYCLHSDTLHMDALTVSGCSCVELSKNYNKELEDEKKRIIEEKKLRNEVVNTELTPHEKLSEHSIYNWCNHNTARLLCNIIGYCGIWDCEMSDFMCPRYEWNKKTIKYKGKGHCIRGDSTKNISFSFNIYIGLLLVSTLFLFF